MMCNDAFEPGNAPEAEVRWSHIPAYLAAEPGSMAQEWFTLRWAVCAQGAGFNPQSMLYVVEGRPLCLMTLTYNEADVEDQFPYIRHLFYPVPCATFLGRTARLQPTCKVSETVFSWFRDLRVSTELGCVC
jgi:hypothetical protein